MGWITHGGSLIGWDLHSRMLTCILNIHNYLRIFVLNGLISYHVDSCLDEVVPLNVVDLLVVLVQVPYDVEAVVDWVPLVHCFPCVGNYDEADRVVHQVESCVVQRDVVDHPVDEDHLVGD